MLVLPTTASDKGPLLLPPHEESTVQAHHLNPDLSNLRFPKWATPPHINKAGMGRVGVSSGNTMSGTAKHGMLITVSLAAFAPPLLHTFPSDFGSS